jgi:hypothetical protein
MSAMDRKSRWMVSTRSTAFRETSNITPVSKQGRSET